MKMFNRHNGFTVLSLDNDFSEYSNLFSAVGKPSVYLLPSYLKSVQCAEKYPCQIMLFSENGNFAMMPCIKRRINDLPVYKDLQHEFWDIIAPHEYSYALTNCEDAGTKKELIAKLLKLIGDYCFSENIVSEFVRFDPFLTDRETVESFYECKMSCQNVYIDLTRDLKEITASFHSSVRKNLNKSLASSLTFCRAEKTDESIEIFIKLYSASMDRLVANEYFYFSREYFYELIKGCPGASLFIVNDIDNQPIAASILLHHGSTAHHHLTGYVADAVDQRPNDFMLYSLIQWAKANSLNYLHLGGGSESICNFKAKFSSNKIPYYIGKRIHNQEVYQQLCDIRFGSQAIQNSNFFPLYRAES